MPHPLSTLGLGRLALSGAMLLMLAGGAALAQQDQPPPPNPAKPGVEMQLVLDKLASLGAKPLEKLTVEEARSQPTVGTAMQELLQESGAEPDARVAAITTRDVTVSGAAGPVKARLYTPPGEGPFPVIIYWHGGGWVIGDIDSYDASARQLAAGAEALVVSLDYRRAPEDPFPAAHDDAVAAYRNVVENVGQWNGDADRLAVAGESAGANLAANVAIAARDNKWRMPDHQLLVYPVAGAAMDTESYTRQAEARPLSKAAMAWFRDKVFSADAANDPRLDLVSRSDLAGLPPATIVNAEIDPLRSEGEAYAAALKAAGVPVTQKTFPGVTHEFFGMSPLVPAAREAMDLATSQLRAAFDQKE